MGRPARDCKAVRSVEEAEDHGAYRYRRTMDNNFRLVNVYITDMKSRKSHRNKVYPPGNPRGMTEIMTCTVS